MEAAATAVVVVRGDDEYGIDLEGVKVPVGKEEKKENI